ncbi:MAG: glutamate 5-kinase [SAR202 cluster bacterium]|nr:glutamate 5-kinase [SAR202 cluster bacterium]
MHSINFIYRKKNFLIMKRLVVKVGTNLITDKSGKLNIKVMESIVSQICHLHKLGYQILLVSSGAVAAGKEALENPIQRKDVPFRQILASIGQSRLMNIYQQLFAEYNVIVSQALLTRKDIDDRIGYLNIRDTLLGLIDHNVVPIINENDVVNTEELGEIIFGDNDTLSALVSNLIDADSLILLSDIDGLYTADPINNKDAKLIKHVDFNDFQIDEYVKDETIHEMSRGGMVAKIEAAKLATTWGSTVYIDSGYKKTVLVDIINNKQEGTVFVSSGDKIESRRRWLLSGLTHNGKVEIDSGAVVALKTKNGSLLPAGIIKIEGQFEKGDIVYIIDSLGNIIGCGVSNYSSVDVNQIKGMNSKDIKNQFNEFTHDEIIHRNNLVIL